MADIRPFPSGNFESRQRLKLQALGKKLDVFLQQYLLLKARLEENQKAWHEAVREYDRLEREIAANA